MPTVTLTENTDNVALPSPVLPRGASLGQALALRRSSRAFAPEPLTLDTVSALLWAGFGVNRSDVGGRTAPSAHNWQETIVYALLPEAAFRYEAHTHHLLVVERRDLRAASGQQDFVATAPLNLVYVADFAHMHDVRDEDRPFLAGVSAGAIAQNVYLYCASAGLATVVRALVDRARLSAELRLAPSQRIMLAQSVGRAAAA